MNNTNMKNLPENGESMLLTNPDDLYLVEGGSIHLETESVLWICQNHKGKMITIVIDKEAVESIERVITKARKIQKEMNVPLEKAMFIASQQILIENKQKKK